MREICLDEGILQSYLDGELSLDMTEQVAGHVAACKACAELLSEAEGELAMFNAAFAAEASWPVPSEELRVRINRAIEAVDVPAAAMEREQGRASRLPAWLKGFADAFAFKPQHAAAFASLFAIVAFGLIFAALYRQPSAPAGVSDRHAVASNPTPAKATDPPSDGGGNGPVIQGTQPLVQTTAPTIEVASNDRHVVTPSRIRRHASASRRSSIKQPGANDVAPNDETLATIQPKLAELPGEKGYLKTIASLTTAIDDGGSNMTMKPTLRAEYERNLALVNQAISATRPVALAKPGDPVAAQFLYSAYQSKIDLLSAVADRQSEAIARR